MVQWFCPFLIALNRLSVQSEAFGDALHSFVKVILPLYSSTTSIVNNKWVLNYMAIYRENNTEGTGDPIIVDEDTN